MFLTNVYRFFEILSLRHIQVFERKIFYAKAIQEMPVVLVIKFWCSALYLLEFRKGSESLAE